ncbi:MAG: cytochrome c [Deltaproteobacteria bacterium]|nr:cytochrome c [Deltaproteobacteria bacterium]
MKRSLLLACAAVLLCAGVCNVDPMRDQPKYEAYEENPFFEDHRAMRPWVVGAVAREEALVSPEVATGMVGADAGPVAEVPIPLTRADLERGREKYEIFCAACHGVLGDGNSVPAGKMSLRPPPSLHTDTLRARPAGHFYAVIARGFGMMPNYARQLPIAERWRVVAYLQALQQSQHVPLKQAPPDVREELKKKEAP